MEALLMAAILHALCLHQGFQGAAISSNEYGTNTSRRDERLEKQSTGGQRIPSLSVDCSGSLLALHHGGWVAVTLRQQINETKKDMAQHCKDLGCGGVFDNNSTVSMNTCLSECTIINSNLRNCPAVAPDNCSNVTEVVCAWQAVQLIGGQDRCAGRVELFGAGGWGSVCDDGWDMKGGDVVCAQLGCGTALLVLGEGGGFDPGSGPIHISQLNCSGTERNLWQCITDLHRGGNYCGHKEDAAVVCSGSSYISSTTMNTFLTDFTNWTTEAVTVVAAEYNSGRVSGPILGCILLSITLLLLLFINAAQCAYYKRQNGGPEARIPLQASQRDNSDTSSGSDYEHYFNPDPRLTTSVNNCEQNDTLRVDNCNQNQGRFCEEGNAEQSPVLDSESTSSVEFYEKTETETGNLLNPADNQFYPEHSLQMTPLHSTSEPPKSDLDSFDSDSTTSGECYINTGVNAEPFLQTLEGNPSLPEQPLLSHPIPLMTGNNSVSQPYSPNQDHALDSESTSSGECYENTGPETEDLLNRAVNQVYPEHCILMTPSQNTNEPVKSYLMIEIPLITEAKTSTLSAVAADSFDLDSTSSGECYENIGEYPEPQTLEGNPSLSEQPPLSHPLPQMAGNSSVSQPYPADQDDSSTSFGEDYENVAEIKESSFARSEHSVHTSSDSDYDDVSNW